MAEVIFPHLGYGDAEGTVLAWLKQPGEAVVPGEDVVEVASEKAVHVITAQEAGVLLAVYAPVGARVAQGVVLGWVGAAGSQAPQHTPRLLGWDESLAPMPEALRSALPLTPGSAAPNLATPPQHSQLSPEGGHYHGTVPEKAARAWLKAQLRPTTARRMAHSWQAPKVDLFMDMDMTQVIGHRQGLKNSGQEAASVNAYLARAVARAFADHPHLNGHWVAGDWRPLNTVSVGFAVAINGSGEAAGGGPTPGGLLTVSLKDLAGASLDEIQSRFKSMIRKALTMALTREDQFANSLTITNLGELGLNSFTALLNPPEIFILAVGATQERPVVRQGQVVVRPICTLCLSFDHRAVDGLPAAHFFNTLQKHLEGPQ